jgi:hypothetical protein
MAALMGDLPPSRSQDDEAHESDGDEGGGGCGDGDGDGGVAVGVVGDGGGAYGGDERGVAGPVMGKTSFGMIPLGCGNKQSAMTWSLDNFEPSSASVLPQR